MSSQLAGVNTAGNPSKPDFHTTTSDAFAKDIVRRIDAPWRWAAANPVHAIMAYFVGLLPERMAEGMVVKEMERQWGPDFKGKKSD